jgi:hypothetical protein
MALYWLGFRKENGGEMVSGDVALVTCTRMIVRD